MTRIIDIGCLRKEKRLKKTSEQLNINIDFQFKYNLYIVEQETFTFLENLKKGCLSKSSIDILFDSSINEIYDSSIDTDYKKSCRSIKE